jgi:hypothetical protein
MLAREVPAAQDQGASFIKHQGAKANRMALTMIAKIARAQVRLIGLVDESRAS